MRLEQPARLEPGVLDELLKKISKAQLLSIVDSSEKRIALWSGSVSAGKTFASLIAFLLAIKDAPTNGLIVIVGNSIDTIYTNVFEQLQNVELFGSDVTSQIKYTPGATKAHILGREIILVGASNAASVKRIQGKTCVNVEHLIAGTHAQNVEDRTNRRRDSAIRGEQHHAAKMTQGKVDELMSRKAAGESIYGMYKEFGISYAQAKAIVAGRKWKPLP